MSRAHPSVAACNESSSNGRSPATREPSPGLVEAFASQQYASLILRDRDRAQDAVRTRGCLPVESGAVPAVDANTISDNAIGIVVQGSSTPTLSGNMFCRNEHDLVVREGSGLTLDGNSVCEG